MKLNRRVRGYLFLSIILISILACGAQPTPFSLPPVFIAFTPTAINSPTLIPSTPTIALTEKRIGAAVPQLLREQVNGLEGSFTLDISPASESTPNQIQWVYVLVAPFPTIRDDVTQVLWIEGH